MTTTAKTLRGSVLGVALLALGGTASADPNNIIPTTPTSPTTTTTTTTRTTPTTTTDDAVPTPPPRNDDAISHPMAPAYVDYDVNPPPMSTSTGRYSEQQTFYERYGLGISIGGGVEGFVDKTQRSDTSVGGSWNVRVMLGTHARLAGEVSYIGSAQAINGLGLETDALLVGNGAQAVARGNLMTGDVQPFIYGGVAWKHYTLNRTVTRTSDLIDKDNVVEWPIGVGVASAYGGLLLDLRGEYRLASNGDLFRVVDPNDRPDRYGVNANIGYAF